MIYSFAPILGTDLIQLVNGKEIILQCDKKYQAKIHRLVVHLNKKYKPKTPVKNLKRFVKNVRCALNDFDWRPVK